MAICAAPTGSTVGVTIYNMDAAGLPTIVQTARVVIAERGTTGTWVVAENTALNQYVEWDITTLGVAAVASEPLWAGRAESNAVAIAAVKAKTDNLPAVPASKADADAATTAANAATTAIGEKPVTPATDISEVSSVVELLAKYMKNELQRLDNGDGTITVTLLDDDDLTPLLTWTYQVATTTREKAV